MLRSNGILALTVLAVGTLACDDGTSTEEEEVFAGSFSATVTGDFQASYEGEGFFGESTDPETGETVWIVYLISDGESSQADAALYFVRYAARPGPGTYDLDDAGDENFGAGDMSAMLIGSTEDSSLFVHSTGGSLTITESSSGRVEGTFSIDAAGVVLTGGEQSEVTVTIAGEFDVADGTVFFPSG